MILNLWIRLFTNPEGWAEEAEKEASRAVAAFDELGDARGLNKAWSLLALVHILRAGSAQQNRPGEAASHANRAGDSRDELESLAWVPLMIWAGPTEAEAGIARCEQIRERVGNDKKALPRRSSRGRSSKRASGASTKPAPASTTPERSCRRRSPFGSAAAGPVRRLGGAHRRRRGSGRARARAGYEVLTEIGEVSWLSTVAAILGEAVYAQGRLAEAEELVKLSESMAPPDDVYSNVTWRSVRAKVRARRGDAEAERLAAEAVELARTGDFLHLQWHALMSQAEVLELLDVRSRPVRRPTRP